MAYRSVNLCAGPAQLWYSVIQMIYHGQLMFFTAIPGKKWKNSLPAVSRRRRMLACAMNTE